MQEESSDSSLFKLGFQTLFVFVVSALLLNWLVTKLSNYFSKWMKSGDQISIPETSEAIQRYTSEKKDIVNELQKKYNEKAQDYSERIAIPREEEKLRKRIEKCERFSGPAWKGEGHLLGAEESAELNDFENEDLSPVQNAARRRIVQEHINQRVLASSQQSKKVPEKKEIKLPQEPEKVGDDVITIVFRTPIGTNCQRKFFMENTVQNVLDFITTKGFSQRLYTLATSYPRVTLDDSNLTLGDLKLGHRVVLNIEDRD